MPSSFNISGFGYSNMSYGPAPAPASTSYAYGYNPNQEIERAQMELQEAISEQQQLQIKYAGNNSDEAIQLGSIANMRIENASQRVYQLQQKQADARAREADARARADAAQASVNDTGMYGDFGYNPDQQIEQAQMELQKAISAQQQLQIKYAGNNSDEAIELGSIANMRIENASQRVYQLQQEQADARAREAAVRAREADAMMKAQADAARARDADAMMKAQADAAQAHARAREADAMMKAQADAARARDADARARADAAHAREAEAAVRAAAASQAIADAKTEILEVIQQPPRAPTPQEITDLQAARELADSKAKILEVISQPPRAPTPQEIAELQAAQAHAREAEADLRAYAMMKQDAMMQQQQMMQQQTAAAEASRALADAKTEILEVIQQPPRGPTPQEIADLQAALALADAKAKILEVISQPPRAPTPQEIADASRAQARADADSTAAAAARDKAIMQRQTSPSPARSPALGPSMTSQKIGSMPVPGPSMTVPPQMKELERKKQELLEQQKKAATERALAEEKALEDRRIKIVLSSKNILNIQKTIRASLKSTWEVKNKKKIKIINFVPRILNALGVQQKNYTNINNFIDDIVNDLIWQMYTRKTSINKPFGKDVSGTKLYTDNVTFLNGIINIKFDGNSYSNYYMKNLTYNSITSTNFISTLINVMGNYINCMINSAILNDGKLVNVYVNPIISHFTNVTSTEVDSKSAFGSMSNTNKYLLIIGILLIVFVLYKKKKLNFFGKRK